jgi:hypothetical protein
LPDDIEQFLFLKTDPSISRALQQKAIHGLLVAHHSCCNDQGNSCESFAQPGVISRRIEQGHLPILKIRRLQIDPVSNDDFRMSGALSDKILPERKKTSVS